MNKTIIQIDPRSLNDFKAFSENNGNIKVVSFNKELKTNITEDEISELKTLDINNIVKKDAYLHPTQDDAFLLFNFETEIKISDFRILSEVNSFNYITSDNVSVKTDFNLYNKSFPTKCVDYDLIGKIGRNPLALVFKKFKDMSNDEAIIKLYVASSDDYISTLPELDVEIHDSMYVFPKVSLNVNGVNDVSKDGKITIEVKLTDDSGDVLKENITIKAKSDMGYLPYVKRLTDSNGVARFTFKASDLEIGDIAKIKFGFSDYSNVVDKDINVV